LFTSRIVQRRAASPGIDAPTVERIVIQEVTDGAHDILLRPVELPGLAVDAQGTIRCRAGCCTANGVWPCIWNPKTSERRGAICWILATRPRRARTASIPENRPCRGGRTNHEPRPLRPLWRADGFSRSTAYENAQTCAFTRAERTPSATGCCALRKAFSDYGPMIDRRRLKSSEIEIEGHAFTTGRCRGPASSMCCRTVGSNSELRTGSAVTRFTFYLPPDGTERDLWALGGDRTEKGWFRIAAMDMEILNRRLEVTGVC
jgi:hypothetical protein